MSDFRIIIEIIIRVLIIVFGGWMLTILIGEMIAETRDLIANIKEYKKKEKKQKRKNKDKINDIKLERMILKYNDMITGYYVEIMLNSCQDMSIEEIEVIYKYIQNLTFPIEEIKKLDKDTKEYILKSITEFVNKYE